MQSIYHTVCVSHMEVLSAIHRAEKDFKEFAHTQSGTEELLWLPTENMTNFFVAPAALSALHSCNHYGM